MSYETYQNSFLALQRRVFLATRRLVHAELEHVGITDAQVEVLMQLWQCDGQSQRDIQERMNVASATCTGIVDSLVANNLVRREISPADARVKLLFLTDHARAIEQALGIAKRDIEQRLLAGFSPDETAFLIAACKRMAENLGVAACTPIQAVKGIDRFTVVEEKN
jgi:DNA-binding MarR family transcriptional regulator